MKDFSGTESDNTADTAEFSQDEFDNVEVEAVVNGAFEVTDIPPIIIIFFKRILLVHML